MGPRPNGRGKSPSGRGAAPLTMRQWGRGQTAAERKRGPTRRPCTTGVNGAAAKRPRKEEVAGSGAAHRKARQWGRGQTAAESTCGRRSPPASPASMGPRPNGRGKTLLGALPCSASMRQWGRGQTAAESRTLNVSELLPLERQWGRGQTAAESSNSGACWGPKARVNGAAAKRPRKGG